MSTDALVVQQLECEARVLGAWFSDDRFQRAWVPQRELFAAPMTRSLAEVFADRGAGLGEDALVLELKKRDKLRHFAGGAEGVYELLNGTPYVSDPWRELERLRELAGLRALRNGLQAALSATQQATDLATAQGLTTQALRESSSACGSRLRSVQWAMTTAYKVVTNPDRRPGCITGSVRLDHATGGVRPEFCWVVAAETSWGKSSWLLQVLDLNSSIGRRVLVVTVEDAIELYGQRLLARRARLNAWRLREGDLTDEHRRRIARELAEAEQKPTFLDGRGRSYEQIAADIRSAVLGEGIELVLVDYLQAMHTAKAEKRRDEVGGAARTITDAIKTSGAGGILFSQITPDANKKTPDKYSVRENKDIANAAEVVALGYYETVEGLDTSGRKTGKAQRERWMNVDKVKDGTAGQHIQMNWNPLWAGFEPDEDYEQKMYEERNAEAETG